MKRALSLLSLVLVVALLAGCQAAPPTPTVAPTVAPTAPPAPAKPHDTFGLEVIGPEGIEVLSMEDLKALPATEGYAGIKNSVGQVFPPLPCKGVSLEELCNLVGGIGPDQGVNVVAKDGYAMTLSYDQAIKGDLVLYDPGTGDETTIDQAVTLIVAYEQDGKPIPEDEEGPLRLMGVSPKNNQVIDGHWSVKWVRQVVVKSMTEEWVLQLTGELSEEMDRATFESGAAPLCHGHSWTDADGHKWTGIPLWLLVGRVDDDVKHETRAFNDDLAEAGYTVEVIAADGFSASFESETIMFDDELIVAHLMDDQPLENEYFPLRLVGPNLSKREMVSQIAEIAIQAPSEPAAAEPAPPAVESDATLLISGLLETEATFTWADLQAMDVKTMESEHPKQGMQTNTGVCLKTLLAGLGMKDEAQALVFVASDGYQAEVSLAELQPCVGCLVAFDEDGTFKMVMPGFSSKAWVSDVVQIHVGLAGEQAAPAPTKPAAEAAPPPAESDATLQISGLVDAETTFGWAELWAMGAETIEAEHPKKGVQTYQGLRLNGLLEQVGVQDGAQTVVFVASDGYQAEVALADLQACADGIIAFDESGRFAVVLPGLPSSAWVKDVVQIDVQ